MGHGVRAFPLSLAIVGLGFCARSMSVAGAAPPTPTAEPVVLIVGESECGDAFSPAFFAAKDRVRPAVAGEVAREFEVTFARQPNGAVKAQLVVRDGTREAKREVRGQGCSDTTRSLLLIARLTLDEGAGLRASPEAGPPESPHATSAPDASPPDPDTNDASVRAPPTPRSAAEGDVVLGLRAAGLTSPSLVIAPGLGFEWRGEVGAIPVVAGAGFSGGLPSEIARANGGARLIWLLPEMRLCVGAFRWNARVNLEPCARIEVGALSATGLRAAEAQSEVRAWVAPSLSARLRWRFAGNVSLGTEGGLTVPLIRDEFVLTSPSATQPRELYKPPAVAGFFGLSLHVTIF